LGAVELLDAEVRFRNAQQQHINNWYQFLETESSLLQQMGQDDISILQNLIITK